MGLMEGIRARHERLKARVHAFRIPLSPRGQIAMNIVYFAVPIITGHYVIQWAQGRARANLREAGVMPEDGEPEKQSKTPKQNAFIKKRLKEIKAGA